MQKKRFKNTNKNNIMKYKSDILKILKINKALSHRLMVSMVEFLCHLIHHRLKTFESQENQAKF